MHLNGTCSMRYQKAALRAYATFLSGNALLLSSSNVTVDVTDLVAFESSDVVVATVGTSSINDAAVLEGHAPGVTEVSVVLSESRSARPASHWIHTLMDVSLRPTQYCPAKQDVQGVAASSSLSI